MSLQSEPPRIYLDHNATTPLRPEVAAAMGEVLGSVFGNASSTHALGRKARARVEEARAAVAALVSASPEEIVFTSGGTEGDNLAIRGLALEARARRGLAAGHIVTSPLEHPAVLGALDELAGQGFSIARVAVGPHGEIDPAAVAAAMRPDTVLVTLAAANHELGNAYPLRAFADVAHQGGALFHTDAVQAAGKVALDLVAADVDAATLSAHKLYGPQGVGALFVRRGVALHPLLAGGHQERDRRPGTENVAAIVGFGVAARLAGGELGEVGARLTTLRERLERQLLQIEGARLHGMAGARVPGTTNVAFAGAPGQLVAINLDLAGICVSTGAACTSGSPQPSSVLRGLGLSATAAAEGVRLSLGRSTTEAEIDRVVALLPEIVARVRRASRRGRSSFAGPSPSREVRNPSEGSEVDSPGRAPTPSPVSRGAPDRVVVAMSGGVDSSTAAALLLESGVEVVGVTLKLYDASGTAASIGGRCCSPRDIEDARATAAALGFPHYVIDESEAFAHDVIDEFVHQHRVGQTPNPCVRCNEKLKFGPLLAFADAIGASALATGHYARLEAGADPEAPQLLRAVDRDKDQSYFLFGIRPALFSNVRFPLGDRTKAEVRALARRYGLPNADKPDSQEICFIPDGDHLAFVEKHGGAGPAGVMRDEAGAVLGAHDGTHRFTVGQRRGVPALGGQRRFVLRVDAGTGDVIVGPRDSLGRQAVRVADVRWVAFDVVPTERLRCDVQIRHHALPARAWIAATGDGAVDVQLDAPAHGVAPGQAAVFYDGDRVLGGGWIV